MTYIPAELRRLVIERVTGFLLRLNAPSQIEQREILIEEGRYPCQPTL
jgi:hypothetical protein